MVNIQRLDILNIFFMLLACAIAYVSPWQLLLFAYAILGPAHYLTQISWMHDRQYFTQKKTDYQYLLVIALMVVIPTFFVVHLSLVLALLLGLSAAFVFASSFQGRIKIFVIAMVVMLALMMNKYVLLFLFLVPTLIHVYVFTAGFILNGAIKNKSFAGFLSFVVLLGCGATFFIFSPPQMADNSVFVCQNMGYFKDIATRIMQDFGVQDTSQSTLNIIRFTAYAYTYHYLNWFLKTGLIRWHEISSRRAIFIGFAYLFFVGLYCYNYSVGFAAVLLLSFGHVILEFPLDILTFKNIGQTCLKRIFVLKK